MSFLIGRGRYARETYAAPGDRAAPPSRDEQSSFVWQPGGTGTGPTVFSSALAAVQAANALGATCTIFVDASIVPGPTMDVGAYVGMAKIQWISSDGSLNVTVPTGVTWDALPNLIQEVSFISTSTAPIITYGAAEAGILPSCYVNLAGLGRGAPGSPFVMMPTGAGIVALFGVALDLLPSFAEVDGTSTMVVRIFAGNILGTNVFTGTGTVNVLYDSAAGVPATQPGLTTYTLIPLSKAVNETYTASTVGDWSGANPTSVANALDRIAAHIAAYPVGWPGNIP